ncbi:putative lipase 4 protein [Botrytis fragariae]|uniref:Carboxylic ester hydrolase n=1 Tax=Botrytis fragariae TaxID=1964551 RepID=A0A8H6AWM6_9HELO|nr:putative lipase 4 protein [Botrytis fragariae]KAF5874933.1 putative lipase 4 protein [Botrytis fragariae]
MHFQGITTWLLISLTVALPAPERRQLAPIVQISHAKIIGSSTSGIDTFKGIPYAQPPTGSLRLKPPKSIIKDLGTIQATNVPTACPQGSASGPVGEDCLTLNIQRPSNITGYSKLPVLFWIYGGAFVGGSTQSFDATQLLQTSISSSQPFIYVAVNYRLGGFGFLAGSEILNDGSSNLGLLDQRLGLQWVADNIASFGGDPNKVTIWGESAGSISVFDQMALYGGQYHYKNKPLFRGAIMDSGSVTPAQTVDSPRAQAVYDQVVLASGCQNSTHTLKCLRALPYETFLAATLTPPSYTSYTSLALSYLPRPDHKNGVLPASPEILASHGQFAPVPFIIGDQEDEGTYFALVQTNLTTTSLLTSYLQTIFFPSAPPSKIASLVAAYPDDPSAGSPFNTGTNWNIYPQYKRLAALLGDIVFTLSRRLFLNYSSQIHKTVKMYSYLSSYGYGTPILGTFHGSDIGVVYGQSLGFPQQSIQKYYLNFLHTLDPNLGANHQYARGGDNHNSHPSTNTTANTNTTQTLTWPPWTPQQKQLLNFQAAQNVLITDDFRQTQYEVIKSVVGVLHV